MLSYTAYPKNRSVYGQARTDAGDLPRMRCRFCAEWVDVDQLSAARHLTFACSKVPQHLSEAVRQLPEVIPKTDFIAKAKNLSAVTGEMVLIALAEMGSMTIVARHFGLVGHSSIQHRVRRLEARHGEKLINRCQRRAVTLTEAGLKLVAQLKAAK